MDDVSAPDYLIFGRVERWRGGRGSRGVAVADGFHLNVGASAYRIHFPRGMDTKEKTVELDDDEREAALELLRDPNLLDRILTDFDRCGVVGENGRHWGPVAVVEEPNDFRLYRDFAENDTAKSLGSSSSLESTELITDHSFQAVALLVSAAKSTFAVPLANNSSLLRVHWIVFLDHTRRQYAVCAGSGPYGGIQSNRWQQSASLWPRRPPSRQWTIRSLWSSGVVLAPRLGSQRYGMRLSISFEWESSMKISSDFADLLRILSEHRARFLIVGAYAVAQHAEPRYTKDLDLWVDPTDHNAENVHRSLIAFGAPTADLSPMDLQTPGVVFQIGVEPVRIDVLTSIGDIDFSSAFENALNVSFAGVPVKVLGLDDLITAKRSAGRPQDLLDLEKLEAARSRD